MTDTATRQLTYRVREENSGLDLGALLTARFTYHTLGEWTALAAAGRLLVNGSAAEAGRKLAVGDSVTFLQPDRSGRRPKPPPIIGHDLAFSTESINAP